MDFNTLRQKYPGYADDEILGALKATKYPDYSIEEIGKAVGYNPSDFGRGLKESFQQLPQLGYGLLAGAGAVGESVVGEGGLMTGLKKAGVQGYNDWGAKVSAGARPSDDLDYSYDQAKEGNFGALVDWLQHGLGYVGGQGLQALASAGIGAAGGKLVLGTAAKEIAKGMVLKEASVIGATEEGKALAKDAIIAQATKQVAAKFSNLGQAVGVGAQAFGMEGGEIFGGLASDADKDGRQLTGEELAKAFGATLAAGSLEFVGDKLGLDIVMGKSRVGNKLMGMAGEAPGIGGKLARGAIAGLAAAPAEAGTEYFQTGIEEFGKGTEANPLPWEQSPENQRQAFNAAALGALGGAGIGLGGGLMSKSQQRAQEQVKAADASQRLATASTVEDMVTAANDLAMAPLIPVGEVTEEMPLPVGEAQELTGPEAFGQIALPPVPGQMLKPGQRIPRADVTEITPEDIELGQIPVGEAIEVGGPRPEGMAERTGLRQGVAIDPTGPNAVAQYVNRQRQINTPAARSFVRDFEAGRITPADVQALLPRPARTAAQDADQRLAAAAAQAPTIQPGDLLTADGMPYGTKAAASVRATREGGGQVVQVPGGFVVRQESTREPVADLDRVADVAVPAGDGGGAVAGGSGGNLGPLPDADRGGQPAAAAPVPGGRAADAVGAGPEGVPGALTPAVPDGTPRRGEVGGKLAGGEVVSTSSGRLTTPFPKVSTGSNRAATNTVSAVDKWLLDNAAAEARARGDEFNAPIFEADAKAKNIPQASKDAAEEYLFGQQPAVTPPTLRPLKDRVSDLKAAPAPAAAPADQTAPPQGRVPEAAAPTEPAGATPTLKDRVDAKKTPAVATPAAPPLKQRVKAMKERGKATPQAAIDAFNADDTKTAVEVMAALKIDDLKEVGAAVGFRPQINETAKAFRERIGGVADRLTKTNREKSARQKALYDKLIDRAMDYDRAADHMANSLRLGNAIDSDANTTSYKPMDGGESKWLPIPQALDKYAADVASLRDDPDFAEVAPMVSKARPRVFEHKPAATAATADVAAPAAAPAAPQEAADEDMRGYAWALVKDGKVVRSGSLPSPEFAPASDDTKLSYYKAMADKTGADLHIGGHPGPAAWAPQEGLIFGMTWDELSARQQKGGRAGSAPEGKMPKDAVLAYSPAAPATVATHKDPGEPAEVVTPAVVAEAITTAAKNTDRTRGEMRAEALRLIDEAIAKAPSSADVDALINVNAPITSGGKKEFTGFRAFAADREPGEGIAVQARETRDGWWDVTNINFDGSGTGRKVNTKLGELRGTPAAARDQLRAMLHLLREDGTLAEPETVTIKVEGDGRFTVVNTKERLQAFRKQVEASPGFKDRQTRPPVEDAGDGYQRGSGGPKSAIQNMIDDGDAQAAVDFAAARGVNIREVLSGDKERMPKIAGLTPTTDQVGEFEPEAEAPAPVAKPAAGTFSAEDVFSVYRKAENAARGLWSSSASRNHEGKLKRGLADLGLKPAVAQRVIEQASTVHAQRTRGATTITFISGQDFMAGSRRAGIVADAATATQAEAPPAVPKTPTDALVDKLTAAGFIANRRIVRGRAVVIVSHPSEPSGNFVNVVPDGDGIKIVADEDKSGRVRDRLDGIFATAPAQSAAASATTDAQQAAPSEPAPPAPAAPAKLNTEAKKIEDFGQKLEGARKDYAATLKDAESVDIAAEPLSASWPEPDYQKMLDGGADPYIVAFTRAARDELPTKPQTAWKLKGWVQKVEMLRGLSQKLLSGVVTPARLREMLASKEWQTLRDSVGSRAELYELVGHDRSLKGITFAEHHYSLYKGQENVHKWVVEQKAKATMFSNWPRELAVGDTKAEMLENFKAKIATLDTGPKAKGQAQFVVYRKRGQTGAFVGKKIGREYIDLHKAEDVTAARKYMQENAAELEKALEAYKQTPFERKTENQPRVGDDHRNGAQVTPEIFAETFGFRGVQFGNYVEQGRRQSDLNQAFDGLMDMAAVLGIPPRAISLNGKLGLAFGARGKGGTNAPAAHYEPGNVVINLTKGSGPGSLAHEWWHSLDNYFGKESGTGGYGTGGTLGDKTRAEMKAAFEAVKKATQTKTLRQRAAELDKRKSKPYWDTPIELSARSFEMYVIAKLQDQGASNDYLANVVSKEFWDAQEAMRAGMLTETKPSPTFPYPIGDEMPAVRAAFDDFFKTVQTRADDAGNVAMFSLADNDSLQGVEDGTGRGFWGRLVRLREGLAAARIGDEIVRPGGLRVGRYAGSQPARLATGIEQVAFDDKIAGFDGVISFASEYTGGDGRTLFRMYVMPMDLVREATIEQLQSAEYREQASVIKVTLIGTRETGFDLAVESPIEGDIAYERAAPGSFEPTGRTDVNGNEYQQLRIGDRATRDYLTEAVRRFGLRFGYAPNVTFKRDTGAKPGEEVRSVSARQVEQKYSLAERVAALRRDDRLDATIDRDYVPADTAAYEPAGNADTDAVQRLATRLNRGYPKSAHVVLDAVTPRAGANGARARELAAVSTVARRIFGHRIVFVRFQGRPLFNGVASDTEPNVVFLNADSKQPLMAVLGHELLHRLRMESPILYRDLQARLDRMMTGQSAYFDKLKAAYEHHGRTPPKEWMEELHADVVGDFFMDHRFWEEMAAEQPGLFKRVAAAILKFLDDVVNQLSDSRPFGTDKFVQDIAAARAAVASAMRQFGGAQVGSMASQSDGISLSIADAAAERPAGSRVTAQDLVDSRGGVFDFNRLGATKQDRIRTVIDGSRPFWLGTLTRDQIADVYGKEIPPVKDYDALTRSMENERSKMAGDADTLYGEWAKIDQAANDRLARIMLDATVHQVHPDQPFNATGENDDERRRVHGMISTQFKLLPPEAKAMYGKVKAFHIDTLTKLRDALMARIERQVEGGKAKAAALTNIRVMFDKYLGSGPYFPLSRFGDFLVVAKREDGERVVASYETAGEQQAAARKLESDGFTVKLKTAKTYSREQDGAAGKFIGDVLTAVDALDMDDASVGGRVADLKGKLLDDINQMFIKALPDLSYRKHFMHRKGTPGFSSDVMRGFASSAFHAASHIARLNHGDKMTFALQDAYAAIESAPEGDFNLHSQVINELTKRHDVALNPNTHPIAAMLNQVGFVMYLGLSPAAGIVNMLQTVMVTMPHLGARYGFGKANTSLAAAYKDILAAPANSKNGWNAAQSQKLTAAERAVMTELQDEGVIDLTQAHDLASATGLDTGNVARSKAAFAMSRAMKIVGWTFHIPEVMNRQVTALSAYRLEMEKSGDSEAAKDAAREAIKRTHFDYSASNRARFMSGNVARVITQFKQYSQNMTYLLGRAAHQALKGESPEVRSIARKQLVATLGVTFGMAGALGLPGLGGAMGLIGLLISGMDDDDKPWDWKVEFRNLLNDTVGQAAGEVIAHGVPRALMPWDISSRVSLGELWWRSNDREGQNPREAFANDMQNILGPSAGTLLGIYTAADHMARGNWSKATESIVPKALRDPLKAIREGQEGITNYNGEPLLDVDAAEVLGRAIGFAPARGSEMFEARNAVKNAETVLNEKRQRLLSKIVKARIDGDTEAATELRQDIVEFNQRNPAFRITSDSIIKSTREKRRNMAETEGGIRLPKGKDALRDIGRFAEVG